MKQLKNLLCAIGIHAKKEPLYTTSRNSEVNSHIKIVYDVYRCTNCNSMVEKPRTSFYEYPRPTLKDYEYSN